MTWKRPYLRNLNRITIGDGLEARNREMVLLFEIENRLDPCGAFAIESSVRAEGTCQPEHISGWILSYRHLTDLYTIAWADGRLDQAEKAFLYDYQALNRIPVKIMQTHNLRGKSRAALRVQKLFKRSMQ